MDKCFLKFNELIKNDEIKLTGSKTNQTFYNYSFFYVFEELVFEKHQIIYQRFKESPIIIINQFDDDKFNYNDRYFIVSFKKTILMINQSQVNFLRSLFNINEGAKFCFLTDCQNIFIKNTKNQINIIKFEHFFINEEIPNFKDKIHINNKPAKMFSRNLLDVIKSSIAGYLIKQSYSKLNDKYDLYFSSQSNKNPEEIIYDEDDFIYLRVIGDGSTFKVYLVYLIDKEELYAMKLAFNNSTNLVNREINNYQKINYPLIPKYYGTIKDKNCLIIDFIDGLTLKSIKEMHLNKNEKDTIYFQILIIFNYLHKNGFVYRDLKPNNVIICERKRVYLIDFDRMISNSQETNTTDFASEFVSPDVNEGKISYKNDLYSLFSLLFYIRNEASPTKQTRQINITISDMIRSFYIDCHLNINLDDIPIIKNDSDILLYIGQVYFIDKYGMQDINKSIHYLTLSANFNNPEAQFNLGIIYSEIKNDIQNINKSIYYLTLAANQNHPLAQCKLGFFYYDGKYVNPDINKSINYFTRSADQNNSEAQFNLGVIYYNGKYITRDINKSIHYYSLAANQNNPEAQFNLGVIYYNGKYITRDINKSIHYYSLAANQNHPNAQFNLGLLYYEGIYIAKDINKSIFYFTLSANQNYAQAQFILGFIYYENQYIKRDINRSIYYFSLAANQNHAQAQFNLGRIYYDGIYVERDINKSIYYYTLATYQNHPKAQYNLGIIYEEGNYVARDIQKSIYYYTLAAKQKLSQAQCNLGNIYLNGQFIKQDINKSIYYFSLASDQNNPQAHYNLGFLYYEGKYITRDINKTIHYFSLASKQNIPEAQFNLGFIYYEGKYITRDIKKSIDYFSLAANQNFPEAQFILGYIYYIGDNIPKDIKRGQYFMILASKNGFKRANFSHGFLLHEGRYIKRDIIQAIHYYKEASSFNNEFAKNNLGIMYKNGFGEQIEKRIGNAILYFEEAIRQKNDYLSMYNLAHIYIYEESFTQKDINKQIQLLIESSNEFHCSLFLLCLVLIKQFGNKLTKFELEIEKYIDIKRKLKPLILQTIYSFNLFDKSNFCYYYETFKTIDFLYDIELNPVISSGLQNIKTNFSKYPNAKNISKEFYDGFENA